MFIKAVISTVSLAVALNATSALADTLKWADAGGVSIQKKAPRSNGLNVRFADHFAKKPAKGVRIDTSKNQVFKIGKSGNAHPVNAGKPKSGPIKQGMTGKQARSLNTQKKAVSPKYKEYKHNQQKLAKKGSGGLRVKNGQVVAPKNARFGTTKHTAARVSNGSKLRVHNGKVVPPKNARFGTTKHATARVSKGGGLKVRHGKVVPPKNARFGTTKHLSTTRKGVKTTRKTAKTAKHLKKGAKIAKTGRKLRTVGKIATGGAASMAVGAALGVKVPDAVDTAMFAGKLVTDPKNAHKRLYGAAKGGVRMIGTAATTITDPSRMARNLGGAVNGVGKSIAKTNVYKNLARTKTGRTIGKTTNWTKKKVGAGYNKFKKTKTAKTIGKAAKAVDKQVFKRANKGVKAIGKGTKKASKKIAKGAKKTAKKISKGAKKVAKKLKFW